MHSTSEYCAPVWCYSTHTRIIDSVLSIMHCHWMPAPTPTDFLPTLAGIQLDELCQQEATLYLIYNSLIDPKHLLHQLMLEPITFHKERPQSSTKK